MRLTRSLARSWLLAALALVALVACGETTTADDGTTSSPAPTEQSTQAVGAEAPYPLTVTNCGVDVTFAQAPQRVFLVNADAVPLLAAVNALDAVVARTGTFDPDVFDDATQPALDAIPHLEAEKNATGGAVISQEVILERQPDLVIAPENAVDRDGLAEAGVNLYSPPAYCEQGAPTGEASFDWAYEQVDEYGRIFGARDAAAAAVARLEDRVASLRTSGHDSGLTAAALYVPEGGGTLYPYGAPSMLTPIMSAAGLNNVYGDAGERVFEVNVEDLLERDPDVLVLLHSAGDGHDTIATVAGIPGLEALSAVSEGRLAVLRFAYTDPPTPMSVRGAELLTEWVADHQ